MVERMSQPFVGIHATSIFHICDLDFVVDNNLLERDRALKEAILVIVTWSLCVSLTGREHGQNSSTNVDLSLHFSLSPAPTLRNALLVSGPPSFQHKNLYFSWDFEAKCSFLPLCSQCFSAHNGLYLKRRLPSSSTETATNFEKQLEQSFNYSSSQVCLGFICGLEHIGARAGQGLLSTLKSSQFARSVGA